MVLTMTAVIQMAAGIATIMMTMAMMMMMMMMVILTMQMTMTITMIIFANGCGKISSTDGAHASPLAPWCHDPTNASRIS